MVRRLRLGRRDPLPLAPVGRAPTVALHSSVACAPTRFKMAVTVSLGTPATLPMAWTIVASFLSMPPDACATNAAKTSPPAARGRRTTMAERCTALCDLIEVDLSRLRSRKELLTQLDTLRRDVDTRGEMRAFDSFSGQALDMLTSGKVRRAFDLSDERPETLERYRNGGDNRSTSEYVCPSQRSFILRASVRRRSQPIWISFPSVSVHSVSRRIARALAALTRVAGSHDERRVEQLG